MASTTTLPLVHLIGSVPLDTTEEVFTTLSKQLPARLRCIPDGEVGERKDFCAWQWQKLPTKVLSSHFKNPDQVAAAYEKTNKEGKDGAATADVTLAEFPSTGYDDVAIASYTKFRQLRDQGVIPADVRFQVSLPTPLNSIAFFVDPAYVTRAEELYRERIIEAVKNIQKSIPKEDLAIQWDMPTEMAHMEHAYGPERKDFKALAPHYSPVREGIVTRVGLLAAAVDPSVPMGFHLCYGDAGHEHFVQPVDTSLLVSLINDLHSHLTPKRPINWVHLPVPKDRVDEAYYKPLQDLKLSPETDLVLGLVHANDLKGTQSRIATASSVLGDGRRFGVSTECGMGRTSRDELDSIFEICRDVTGSK
jgi:hypothetical protein